MRTCAHISRPADPRSVYLISALSEISSRASPASRFPFQFQFQFQFPFQFQFACKLFNVRFNINALDYYVAVVLRIQNMETRQNDERTSLSLAMTISRDERTFLSHVNCEVCEMRSEAVRGVRTSPEMSAHLSHPRTRRCAR